MNIYDIFPGSTIVSYIIVNSRVSAILDTLPGGWWLLRDSGYHLEDIQIIILHFQPFNDCRRTDSTRIVVYSTLSLKVF